MKLEGKGRSEDMSKIKFEDKLLNFIKNINKVPEDFFTQRVGSSWRNDSDEAEPRDTLWLLSREDGTAGSYETSQERFGITKDGKIIWGFSSGCSCWDGWSKEDIEEPVTWKEFIMLDTAKTEEAKNYDSGEPYKRDGWGFVESWQDEVDKAISDLSLIFKRRPTLEEVFNVRNAEVRAYLVKKLDYEDIRKAKEIIIKHTDGEYDLLELKGIEDSLFVKCKDSSTDRIFLLQVPRNMRRCKQAVAWTFGLDEKEYNPVIET